MSHNTQSAYRMNSGFSLLTLFVLVVSMLLPVNSTAYASLPQRDPNLLAEVNLQAANVSAPAINKFFDTDGIILANDFADAFTPTGASGDAFLQTRIWPKGEARTKGAGMYAYLYRIDLRNLVSTGTSPKCVNSVKIPYFASLANLDYDGDSILEGAFIITSGGMGNMPPTSITHDSATFAITFYFKEPVCSGTAPGEGDSSFFIGLASPLPYQAVDAPVEGNTFVETLKARATVGATVTCDENLAGPGEIPYPALINFDSLAAGAPIGASYQANYGLDFPIADPDRTIAYIPASFPARSPANVAYQPHNTVGAYFPLTFTFATPVTHVGFYAGHDSAAEVDADVTVYGKSMTGADIVICQKRATLPAGKPDTFFGFYDPSARIRKVEYNIVQNGQAHQIIDDLYFSPGAGERTEFPRPQNPLEAGGPEIIIRGSDNTHLSATFNLPDPAYWLEPEKGTPPTRYLRFGLPGVQVNGGADGYPDIPFYRRLVALPEGATALLSASSIIASDQFSALVMPSQPAAMDGIFDDKPFVIDPLAYESTTPYPAEPVQVVPMGKMRDLNLAVLLVAGGQYIPATKKLTIFKSVDVDISFTGGSGFFLPNYSNNPFEPEIRKQYPGVLNQAELGNYLSQIPGNLTCVGHEFLIVSHPDFLPAANALKDWKISKGISTLVRSSQEIGPDPAQIKNYIKSLYDQCAVRPTYLLLLGDVDKIGNFDHTVTFSYNTDTDYEHSSSSDLDYSLMGDAYDFIPDLAYGRIPVDTLAQANTVVNKIIAFEKTPPTQLSFYKNAAIASYFQCCDQYTGDKGWDERSFVETSEIARNALIYVGKTVQRIYKSYPPSGKIPAFYKSGASLPGPIGYGSGFGWGGSSTDIIAAFNAGKFLIMHRGHGGPDGWADPSFNKTDLSSITNGNLTPVVYSINCASGLWDNETTYSDSQDGGYHLADDYVSWSEQILRMEGGAVSLIGDLRNSPTWANSALARGMFDATWPSTDPYYGDTTVHHRLGDILNYGKLYMLTQVFIPQTAGEVSFDQFKYNNVIYHVIGDPTLELWTGYPYTVNLTKQFSYKWVTVAARQPQALAQQLEVYYPTDGVTITVLQNGEALGRGTVIGGKAIITLVDTYNPDLPWTFSASLDDSIGTLLGVPLYLPAIRK